MASDAKPYYKITPWHDERTGEPLWYVDGPTGRVTCHSEGEAAFAFMLLESAYSSGAAARDGEVGRLRDELDRIAKAEGYIPSLRDTHRWYKPLPSVTAALRAASEAFGGDASALAPGNGGEKHTPTPPDRAGGEKA